MNRVLSLWTSLSGKPLGKWLFARIICWKAPFFGTIAPRFEELRPGFSRVSMRKRRAIHNHIRTVHAIAMCNLAELGAGTMMEASLPTSMRWLPKGMKIQYLKRAETDVTADCTASDIGEGPARDVIVSVDLRDKGGNTVARAEIAMYVSPKKNPA